MEKRLLVTNRQCLIWLGLCPINESTSRWQEHAYAAVAATALIVLICFLVSCLAFGGKYLSIDVGRSVFAFMFSTGVFAMILMTLDGMILLRHEIGSIFDKLSAIYKTSKCVPMAAFHF